jgi:hypothetical protein
MDGLGCCCFVVVVCAWVEGGRLVGKVYLMDKVFDMWFPYRMNPSYNVTYQPSSIIPSLLSICVSFPFQKP